jgi:pectinesterase
MNTYMGPQIVPAGWLEWVHNGAPSLPTVSYDEYNSSGPGANAEARDSHARQLTATEAAKLSVKKFPAGDDGWNPTRVR